MAKYVTWREAASYTAREFGREEGFSRDYRFDAGNQHTVEMEDEDIDRLVQAYPIDAKEFRIRSSAPKGTDDGAPQG